MRTSRSGYLMAMLAGLAIVGASTGGVVAATSHHEQSIALAAAAVTTAQVAPSGSAEPGSASPVSGGPVSSDPASTGPSSTGGPTSSAPPSSAAPNSGPSSPTSPAATSSRSAAAPSAARTSTATTTKDAAPRTTSAAAAPHVFKDGQYSATGSYNSPGGTEKLGVTLTLSADKVTKSILDLQGGAGLSHSFQTAFASGYSTQVIGKTISSISLGAVAGSSLTGMGFIDAVKQIESQARVQK